MAVTKCPKCGHTRFELRTLEPSGAQYKYNFFQCVSCGTPVGVAEYFNAGVLLRKQNAALKKIAAALNVHVDLES
jgi:predicted nucleic-acid-binding Zn-ribbon protein